MGLHSSAGNNGLPLQVWIKLAGGKNWDRSEGTKDKICRGKRITYWQFAMVKKVATAKRTYQKEAGQREVIHMSGRWPEEKANRRTKGRRVKERAEGQIRTEDKWTDSQKDRGTDW